jgi:hypothetical protein
MAVGIPEKSPRIRNKESAVRNLLKHFDKENEQERAEQEQKSKAVPKKALRSTKHTGGALGIQEKSRSFPKSTAEKAKARKGSNAPTKSVLESLTAVNSRQGGKTKKSILESLCEKDQDSYSDMSRFSGGRTALV